MMKGKLCIVTGGSSGVGKSVATRLAHSGATVIIVSRNQEKALKEIKNIIEISGNNEIYWMYADLSSQESIREFVTEFKKQHDKLHLLSCNAGILQLKREETEDGIEKTLAVDYLSHFLLTNLLTESLIKGAPSGITIVAGGKRVIQNAKIYTEDIQLKKNYNGIKATLQAALARVIFSMEMARRLKDKDVSCNAFHPGFVRSGLGNGLPFILRSFSYLIQPFLSKSSNTAVYLATSEKVKNITGKFFIKSKPYDFTYDPDLGKELWKISEKLTNFISSF